MSESDIPLPGFDTSFDAYKDDFFLETAARRFGTRDTSGLVKKLLGYLAGKPPVDQLRSQLIRSVQLLTTEEEANEIQSRFKIKVSWKACLNPNREGSFDAYIKTVSSVDDLSRSLGHELGHTFFFDIRNHKVMRRMVHSDDGLPIFLTARHKKAYSWLVP